MNNYDELRRMAKDLIRDDMSRRGVPWAEAILALLDENEALREELRQAKAMGGWMTGTTGSPALGDAS